jgi:C1A family cysteine protease
MESISQSRGKGWLKDYPDFRDNTPATNKLSERQKFRGATKPVKTLLDELLEQQKQNKVSAKATSGKRVDLSSYCSPIEDQKQLNSCTAHAGTGLYEYYERRAFGKHIDGSRLFLYKTTRNLLRLNTDDGAYLRTTMAALALFGLPPEKYWPYQESEVNTEPDAFHYSYGQNYQALVYYRLDEGGIKGSELLERIKEHLRKGLALIFGFTCFTSLEQANITGRIPFPEANEDQEGGHAVMAVGFDDDIVIVNTSMPDKSTKGAIKIRNSWGTGWGEQGYGWLPYEYVLRGIADDWWTMLKAEWIDTGNFGLTNG